MPRSRSKPLLVALAASASLAVAGCGRSGVVQTTISDLPTADGAVASALELYDRNSDQKLDPDELKAAPGLAANAAATDANGDRSLDREELLARIAQVVDRGVVFRMQPCCVELDGKPLAGAEILLEAEGFFGDMTKPARGVTGPDGRTMLVTEGEPRGGVYPGYYRVRLSKKDAAGRETLPETLNSQTNVGVEIGLIDSQHFEGGELILRLKSK